MKKIILIITILLVIVLYNPKEKILNEDKYQYIYVSHKYLNIDNIKEYLKDLEIIAIEPEINPVYNKILINYKTKEKFKTTLLNYLKKEGDYIDYNKYLIEPIKIKNVLVYSNIQKITEYNLVYHCKKQKI